MVFGVCFVPLCDFVPLSGVLGLFCVFACCSGTCFVLFVWCVVQDGVLFLGVDGCCWMLWRLWIDSGHFGCCWVLLDIGGCCWPLVKVVGCCWTCWGAVGCCWILLDVWLCLYNHLCGKRYIKKEEELGKLCCQRAQGTDSPPQLLQSCMSCAYVWCSGPVLCRCVVFWAHLAPLCGFGDLVPLGGGASL